MEDSKAILHHYRINADGTATIVEADAPPDDKSLVWVHLDGRQAETRKFLKDKLRIDPLLIKSLLAEETRPRLDEFDENALVILRGIHYNPGPEPEDLVSIRVWVGKNRIVSISRRKARAVADLDERVLHGRGPRKVGEFLSMLVNILNDGIEPALHELQEMTDALEEQTLEHPDAEFRNDIAVIRKQAILFRRHIGPQRDVLARLQNSQLQWMKEGDKWYMQDNVDRVSRFIESLDSIRERCQVVQDELNSALTAKLNKNIYILSMITVIFMPLMFVTGLLGINVEGIPGARSPLAFLDVCGILVVVTLAEIWLLKKLKWL